MGYAEAIFLGIVQGVAEFLPVSSSGHLVILQHWLSVDEPSLTFNVALHFGSLLAVVSVLWREWWLMARALVGKAGDETAFGRRLFLLLVVASLPVAVVGLLVRDHIDVAFASPYIPGIMLLVTGLILWYADRARPTGSLEHVTYKNAIWMGLGQALSLLPGLSRSGTTMATGIYTGIDRQAAARFSFLMAVPAIFGATLVESVAWFTGASGDAGSTAITLVGALASAVTSYFAIRFFLSFLRRGRLVWFARYVWLIGGVVLVTAIFGS